jgi:hypothetical protein
MALVKILCHQIMVPADSAEQPAEVPAQATEPEEENEHQEAAALVLAPLAQAAEAAHDSEA